MMNNLKEKLQDMINDNENLEYGENVIENGNIVYDGMTLDLNAMTEYELQCEINEIENAIEGEEMEEEINIEGAIEHLQEILEKLIK